MNESRGSSPTPPEPRRPAVSTPTPRATFLLVSDARLLQCWGREVRRLFNGEAMPYHVGSSLTRHDYRDVDVRVLLDDDQYDALTKVLHADRLNLAVSLWGQKMTGLPIDFQVQRRDEANDKYASKDGHRRNAIGISASALDQTPGDSNV